jgi:tetratricopeptide (TPR) repeat protein
MWIKKRRHKKELSAAIAHSRRFLAEGRHEENLQYLEGGVAERFSDDAEIRLLYGTVLLGPRPKAGLLEISKAIELDPSDPEKLTRAAHIMYDMKQFGQARTYMNRAKELAPEEFVLGPELLALESNFAALDGNDKLAEEGLRSAVEREPKMGGLAVDLARFLANRGRREEALGVIDEALKRTEDAKYLKRLRAEILEEDGSESTASS